jgi:HSP20 family molecular chaperone IbpA
LRSIPLPAELDSHKAEAIFKNGVLTIRLPRLREAKTKVKKSEVRAA